MKKQIKSPDRLPAGQSPWRGAAMWGVCLGGIGIAIAANTVREAANPVAKPAAASASAVHSGAAAAGAEAAGAEAVKPVQPEPLSREYRPSSHFPGVMVRSIPEARTASAPVLQPAAGSRMKLHGLKQGGIRPRGSAGDDYSTAKPRAAGVATERKLKGGGASLRINPAHFPREIVRLPRQDKQTSAPVNR